MSETDAPVLIPGRFLSRLEAPMARLEALCWEVAARPRTVSPSEVLLGVETLSRRYNEPHARGLRFRPDAREQLAQKLFFMLSDLPKAALVVAELARARGWPKKHLRVLDLGAGHGAQGLGLALALQALDAPVDGVDLLALDQDLSALRFLDEVLTETGRCGQLGFALSVAVRPHDLRDALDLAGPFHVILLGSVLNELEPERRVPLLRRLLERLDDDGHLLCLEPALRQTTRDLHEVRRQLLSDGAATVLAPCTHQGPCPMLLSSEDWCHERRAWLPPPRLRDLAQRSGLRRRDLRFSYLVLGRPGTALVSEPRPGALRVVSEPLRSKGRAEVFVCGPSGRRRAVRLKRDRSEENEAFGALKRGDLVWFDGGEPREDWLLVGPDCRVRRTEPP